MRVVQVLTDLIALRGDIFKAHLGTDFAHQGQDAVAVPVACLHGFDEELIGQHVARSTTAATVTESLWTPGRAKLLSYVGAPLEPPFVVLAVLLKL